MLEWYCALLFEGMHLDNQIRYPKPERVNPQSADTQRVESQSEYVEFQIRNS